MSKKIISVLLIFVMAMASFAVSVGAAGKVTDVDSGIAYFEAEDFAATTIAEMHRSSQLTYPSKNPDYPNMGAIAYVGEKTTTYNMNLSKKGLYKVTIYGTSTSGDSSFLLKSEGKTLAGTTIPQQTGGVMMIYAWEFPVVTLESGEQVLEIATSGTTSNTAFIYYYSIEYLGEQQVDFAKTTGAYQAHYLPTLIEAEYFDLGIDGHISADGEATGVFRITDEMDITGSANSYSVQLAKGEMTAYTFNVPVASSYDIYVKTTGDADVIVEFDGYTRKSKTFVSKKDAMGGEVLLDTVYLDEGTYKMMISTESELMEFDYIRFVTSGADGASLDDEVIEKEEVSSNEASVYKMLYVSPNGNDGGDGSQSSPFATLERTKEEVSKINSDMTGDIIVNILPGTYDLNETLVFSPEDGGRNGYKVIFKGTDKFNQSVISGGVEVTGWEKYDDVIYRAPLTGVEDVRNLYVNTFPAVRARSKYLYNLTEIYVEKNSPNIADGVKVSEKNFPKSFLKPEEMELVSNWDWTSQRYRIDDVVYLPESHEYAIEINPVNSNNMSRLGQNTYSFYLENDMTLLDEPGEFYYNKDEGMIYYYPLGNEDLSTAETYVAQKEQFVQFLGTDAERAGNVSFDNIRFIYGACNAISEYGYHGGQSDAMEGNGGYQVGTLPQNGEFGVNTGQFRMDYSENIEFKNCEFIGMGSSVLVMHDSVKNVLIEGNIIRDTSAAAIRIGTYDHRYEKAGVEVCSDIIVTNNVIARTCGELYNNCAVSVYYEKDIKITNNLISEVPYTGISAGWGWEDAVGYDCKNIEIANNHIYRSMSLLYDGGAVYTLGEIKNGTIHDNFFEENGDRGLYNDAGSAHITSWNNVITGGNVCMQLQRVQYLTHHLNVYNTYTDNLKMNEPGESDTITIEEPVFIENGEPWPEEATEITKKAGVLPKYKDLEVKAEMPSWHKRRTCTEIDDMFESKTEKEVKRLRGEYEAEDYMQGGEGVAYHKTLTPLKNNNVYRSEEVRLYYNSTVQSYVVEINEGGEWINYEIDTPESGEYYVDIYAGQWWNDGSIAKIYLDDVLLTDNVPIPNKNEFTTTTVGPFYMEEGEHIFKVEFINSFYFDSFKIYRPNTVIDEALLYQSDDDYDEGVKVYGNGHNEEQHVSYEVPFTDIADHWAGLTIRRLYRLGYINGKSEEIFAPNDDVKVSEAVLMFSRGFETEVTADESKWYESAIENNIISGEIDSDKAITREEFAKVLMKLYSMRKKSFNITIDSEEIFNDMDLIEESNKNYVRGAYELGFILGDENGNFNPKSNLTRAEAAEVLYRIVK